MLTPVDTYFKNIYTKLLALPVTPNLSGGHMYWSKDLAPAYSSQYNFDMLVFPASDRLALPLGKFIAPRVLTEEILWIMRDGSNRVSDLDAKNIHIWDAWALPANSPVGEQGTIGKAYGYQIKHTKYNVALKDISADAWEIAEIMDGAHTKAEYRAYLINTEQANTASVDDYLVGLNQMQYVIQQLIDAPYSRRIITQLWNVRALRDMSLPPCVYETQWLLNDSGQVDLRVTARSSDTFLGLPYNIAQYDILHRIICHLVKRPVGTMAFQLNNVHLYDRHRDAVRTYLANLAELDKAPADQANANQAHPALWLDPAVTHLSEIVYGENLKVTGYYANKHHILKIPADVTITDKEKAQRLAEKFAD